MYQYTRYKTKGNDKLRKLKFNAGTRLPDFKTIFSSTILTNQTRSWRRKKENSTKSREGKQKSSLRKIPSREAIEVKPELIIKPRQIRLLVIGLLDSPKHLVIHLQLLSVVPRIWLWKRLRNSATATLHVIFNGH